MAWTKEQEQAIHESGQNIIVSAGAGSGKTAVLTQRVIEKINSGIHINELLILTFTNAAAQEMKERIRKSLLSDEKYFNELKLLNSSYITTFDAYALSLVKKYHYLLNIPKNISICDDAIIKIKEKEIIDNIFERLYKEHNSDFEYLIQTYCIKNDYNIKKNILSLCESISNKINYKEYLDNINNNLFSESNIKRIYEKYLSLLSNIRKELNVHLNNFSYYVDSNIMDKFNEALNGILTCDIKDIHLYSSTSLPRVGKYPNEESKSIKASIKDCLDELINIASYGDYSSVKETILSNKRIVLAINNILREYMDTLSEFKSSNNLYTFSDIAYLSIKILNDNDSIRNSIKDSFKEIMIDEYQDTNDVQDTFIKLIENNNVYMVGDIKQSIYKFRGSNPNIFKEKYDNYSLNNGGIKIDLIKNFRSRNEVLNSINNIFELLMDNDIGDAKYKESHKMIYGLTNYDTEKINDFNYNASILEYDSDDNYTDSEIEMFTIASDIKYKVSNKIQVYDKEDKVLRDARYSDFVIILDRSKYFDDYKKVFEYMGIPLTIYKDESLTSNTIFLLIKNILELIIKIKKEEYDVDFRYDFVSIARSFLYEYSDNEIYDIVKNNKYFDTNIIKDLSMIESIDSRSISDIFYEVLRITDFYNKINKIGDINKTNIALKNIYEISNDLNNIGYDIYDFINHLNTINDSDMDIRFKSLSSDSNSVKIMTIHGSKGLEYPFCYFADLNHKFNDRDIKDKFILTDNYGIIVYDEDNNLLKELYKYDYKKDEISERLRLFYVALTRAREKITIVLPYKDCEKYSLNEDGVIDSVYRSHINMLSDYVYYVKEYNSEYFDKVDKGNINLSKEYLFVKNKKQSELTSDKTVDVIEINIDSNILESKHFSKEKINIINKEEYSNMKYGTRIHKLLEYIDFNNYDENIIKDKYIRNKINKFMNSEVMSNLKDATIYKEYEFKYTLDDNELNGVIDLMIEHDSYIDIIDYKLKSISDTEYIKQLNGYKDYISSISNKKINLYLYSIIDEKLEII